MNRETLIVVGMGLEGPISLGPEARAWMARADILAGGPRHLASFPEFAGERLPLTGGTPCWIDRLKNRDRGKITVVLATGDPLFFGIGRLLLDNFPKEELRFVPQVSSVALAFAHLKETWNDACVVSVHGRPLAALEPALVRGEPKIAVFTDAHNHPAAIGRLVCDLGVGTHYTLWVCEELGSAQERVTRWAPADLQQQTFASMNVVVLLRDPARTAATIASTDCVSFIPSAHPLPLLGIPEEALCHRGTRRGMITKRAVRLQALCQLELHAGEVFWDVGAGSGSVALEAARLAPTLSVYAIEKNAESVQHLEANKKQLETANLQVISGEAPEILMNLPDPDAVFVGGTGGRLLDLLDSVLQRLRPGGRLVLSCITLETLSATWSWMGENRLDPQVMSLQLAHSRPLGNLHSLEPDPPLFLVRVIKR